MFVCSGFESGDPTVFLEYSSSAECVSWLAVLRDANMEALRRRVSNLRTLIKNIALQTPEHTHYAACCTAEDESLGDDIGAGVCVHILCVRNTNQSAILT